MLSGAPLLHIDSGTEESAPKDMAMGSDAVALRISSEYGQTLDSVLIATGIVGMAIVTGSPVSHNTYDIPNTVHNKYVTRLYFSPLFDIPLGKF